MAEPTCTRCGAPASYADESGTPLCCDCFHRPATPPLPLRPLIETTTLKYAPHDRVPVCFVERDPQELIAALHAEGHALYRAAMVCVLTSHIRAYLEQHDPKALAQLRAACGLVTPPTFDAAGTDDAHARRGA